MRPHQIPPLLLALTTAVLSAPATAPIPDITWQFQGQGKIIGINGTFDDNVISDESKLGCLNEAGVLTADDCAIFTRANNFPNSLSTSAGVCTFHNTRTPQNKESYYGSDTHAWFCGNDEDAAGRKESRGVGESFYTVRGFSHPFLCTGDFGCYFEIKEPAAKKSISEVVWQFYWGGHQMDVIPGHMKIVWLWVPVGNNEV